MDDNIEHVYISETRSGDMPGLGLAKYLETGLHADMTLCYGHNNALTLKAHKVILCSQSPYFARQIEHPISDLHRHTLILRDDDPFSVKGMLEFLYTGTYAPIHEVILREYPDIPPLNYHIEIYHTAVKYDVPRLRERAVNLFVAAAKDVVASVGEEYGEEENERIIGPFVSALGLMFREVRREDEAREGDGMEEVDPMREVTLRLIGENIERLVYVESFVRLVDKNGMLAADLERALKGEELRVEIGYDVGWWLGDTKLIFSWA